MFSFSFDDFFPNSSVTIPGYDTPSPTIGGFDTSTLPDFGSVTAFNNTFQDITSAQMPSFTFAFDSNYMQMPQFEPIRNLVPNILVQQDQIKAINSDLINKMPALQEQFNGYKTTYDANITPYNNAMATYNQYIRYRDQTRPGSYLYSRHNNNANQKLIEANQYVQAINNASAQYEQSYTTYQTEAQRLKESVDQYNKSVLDYETKTKAIADETRRQIDTEKERKELERKQEEERVTAETRAEQERLAEQQRLEKIALEEKVQEDARLAEIKRQQDEAEQTRLKTEEDARIKAEDDARLKQIADELAKNNTIDTPPTLVASTGNASVTITQPEDISNVVTTTPTVTDTTEPPPVTTEPSPELPDLDTTPTDTVTPPTDQDLIDLIINPSITTPVTTPPVTPPVTEPTAPLEPVAPVTPEPTVTPPPDALPVDEVPIDKLPVDKVPVDEEVVDETVKPPTKTVKDTPNVNLTILDIPNRRTLPANRALASSLNLNTNVGTVLGTGLSTRPDISSTSEPYLLESDNKKRRDVWNTESLRGALGI
jgi:hypothetical protein